MAADAERLAQITDLTEVTVSTATYDELVRAFNKMSGRGVRIDRRWSERRLREEVSGMIIRETARFIREDEVAAEKAARQELLDAKKAERGDYAEFAKSVYSKVEGRSDDEDKLAHAAYSISRARKVAEESITKFAGEIVKNPSYALSWSFDQFRNAARVEVAARFQSLVEGGYDSQVIKDEVIRNAVRAASSNNRSTSATSNLMEDELRVAWVELARELGFNYY